MSTPLTKTGAPVAGWKAESMVSCFFVEEMLRIRRRAIGLRVLRTRDEVLRVGRRVMRLDERTRERVERRACLRR